MNIKNTIPSLPTNKRYKRLYAGSLDDTAEHEDMQAILEYIVSPISYPGQMLYCKDEDKLYRIGLDVNDNKILREVGGAATVDAQNIIYTNTSYPEISNLKEALDYILENLGGSSKDYSRTVYFGVSDADGLETPITVEQVLSSFDKTDIQNPKAQSDIDVEREYNHVRINYGINQAPKYFFLAIPVKNGKAIARDLSTPFGDGWFNWGEDDASFLKTMSLPNPDGFLQEYILLRSDNMLIDGTSWLFYFKN